MTRKYRIDKKEVSFKDVMKYIEGGLNMEFKEYIVTFMIKKEDGEIISYDYEVEAYWKSHAMGIAFKQWFRDHSGESIYDYTIEQLIDGKYEFV